MKYITFFLSVFMMAFLGAQETQSNKLVYKWIEKGQVNYSYIKPFGIKSFVRLNSDGRQIKEVSEEFDEIIEIQRLPKTARPSDTKNNGIPDNLTDEEFEALRRSRNCKISEENLQKVSKEEAYMKNGEGDLVKLNPDQLASQKKRIQEDVAYYCAE